MALQSSHVERLLQRIAGGDASAKDELLASHRPLVREFIRLRIDRGLAQRVDPSDVVQETLIEVSQRLEDFLQRRPMPFATWLRKTAYQNLARLRRTHLFTESRSPFRELSIPKSGSLLIVDAVFRSEEGPLSKLVRDELVKRVNEFLSQLSDDDRELILMRTCEGLDNATVANILDLDPRLCSKRFARALLKVRKGLRDQEADSSNHPM